MKTLDSLECDDDVIAVPFCEALQRVQPLESEVRPAAGILRLPKLQNPSSMHVSDDMILSVFAPTN